MDNPYKIESSEIIDASKILEEAKSIKDLLNIDLISDSDNIILLKRIVRLLYSEINKLQQEVNTIKPRIRN